MNVGINYVIPFNTNLFRGRGGGGRGVGPGERIYTWKGGIQMDAFKIVRVAGFVMIVAVCLALFAGLDYSNISMGDMGKGVEEFSKFILKAIF